MATLMLLCCGGSSSGSMRSGPHTSCHQWATTWHMFQGAKQHSRRRPDPLVGKRNGVAPAPVNMKTRRSDRNIGAPSRSLGTRRRWAKSRWTTDRSSSGEPSTGALLRPQRRRGAVKIAPRRDFRNPCPWPRPWRRPRRSPCLGTWPWPRPSPSPRPPHTALADEDTKRQVRARRQQKLYRERYRCFVETQEEART